MTANNRLTSDETVRSTAHSHKVDPPNSKWTPPFLVRLGLEVDPPVWVSLLSNYDILTITHIILKMDPPPKSRLGLRKWTTPGQPLIICITLHSINMDRMQ